MPFVYGCLDTTLNNDGTYAASNYAGYGGPNAPNPPANSPCNVDATGAGNNECCDTYNSPTVLIELVGTGDDLFLKSIEESSNTSTNTKISTKFQPKHPPTHS